MKMLFARYVYFFIIFVVLNCSTKAKGAVKFSIGETVYLGKIPTGEVFQVRVDITDAFSNDSDIKNVVTDCSCYKAKLISKGKNLYIELNFKSIQREGLRSGTIVLLPVSSMKQAVRVNYKYLVNNPGNIIYFPLSLDFLRGVPRKKKSLSLVGEASIINATKIVSGNENIKIIEKTISNPIKAEDTIIRKNYDIIVNNVEAIDDGYIRIIKISSQSELYKIPYVIKDVSANNNIFLGPIGYNDSKQFKLNISNLNSEVLISIGGEEFRIQKQISKEGGVEVTVEFKNIERGAIAQLVNKKFDLIMDSDKSRIKTYTVSYIPTN